MRHLRTLGACLVAVLALGAVIASTASAGLPEFGSCEYTARGKYTNEACTERAQHKGEGNYEWYTGKEFGRPARHAEGNPPYKMSSVVYEGEIGPATFETSSGKKLQCQSGRTEMSLENPETEHLGDEESGELFELHGSNKGVKGVLLAFTGCESEGKECHSFAGYEGEITNEEGLIFQDGEYAIGTLGFINKATHEVGLSLTTIAKTSKETPRLLINDAICEGSVGTVWLGGSKTGGNSVISVIKPVDEMTAEFEQVYGQSAAGLQSPASFEGKKEDTLRAYLSNQNIWEPLALSTTSNEHKAYGVQPPVEIKAEP
jgi:hypothetical protein